MRRRIVRLIILTLSVIVLAGVISVVLISNFFLMGSAGVPAEMPDDEAMQSEPTELSVGEEPTEVAAEATSSPTPQVVADARLQVRSDLSGEVIGDGTISLYAPNRITGEQTVRVELELSLNNLYLTPTPAGAVTAFPVTRVTATPRSLNALGTPIPTPTPRLPVYTEMGNLFYQRMGASLFCPPGSFSGCDTERSTRDAQLVTTNTTRFEWFLRPGDDITGTQAMTVELWRTVENIDREIEFITEWQHPFSIEVVSPGIDAGWYPIAVGGSVLLLLVAAGVWVVRRPTGGRGYSGARNKPKVFISYRRRPSWVTARAVANALEARGADVFLDVDDINEGRFAEVLEAAIAECDYFLPVLAPTTLESKWVRREIERAIELNKTIIPVVTDDFSFYDTNLPDGLEELASHNAVKVLPEYFEEAMDRIATRFINMSGDDTEQASGGS